MSDDEIDGPNGGEIDELEEDLDQDEDGAPFWEELATWRIKEILSTTELDAESGVVALDHDDWDPKGRHTVRMFGSLEHLRRTLIEIGDAEIQAHVPWDGGAVFNTDSDAIVDDALEQAGIVSFFESVRPPDDAKLLFSIDRSEAIEQLDVVQTTLEDVNDRLIAYLAEHPELMREIDPRKFEELVAELFRRMKYEVTLTRASKDGGRDILAVRRDDVGTALTLVECKRFSPHHKVGVGLVRSLYGVVESDRASHGVIATTSAFTKGATDFQKNLRYRLSLRDFTDLSEWCKRYKVRG